MIEIFQSYLHRHCGGGDAGALICNFLDESALDEVLINTGDRQRLMLVAARFRKEVTSTALWLLGHGVRIQCFKVTLYELADKLFLNVEQIIPTPEAEEFMIGMSVKAAEEKSTEAELKGRRKLRLQFWEQALEALRNSPCDLLEMDPISWTANRT